MPFNGMLRITGRFNFDSILPPSFIFFSIIKYKKMSLRDIGVFDPVIFLVQPMYVGVIVL